MTEEEIRGKQEPSRAREIARRIFRHENTVLAIIMVGIIAGLAIITKGRTVTIGNITNVGLQSASRGIAAMGQAFVILTGGIDVSVGGLALMAAILGAKLAVGNPSLLVAAIAAMLFLGIGIGALNGTLVSRIGMPALIVTLAMWQITTGGGYLICRGQTIRRLPESLNYFGAGDIAGVPVPVVIFVAVVVAAYFILNHTTFGRSIYAVGGNSVSAWLSGIKVNNVLFSVYAISGFLAAIAGLIMLSRTMCGGMNTVVGLELDSIAAVCIGGISLAGGRGTVIGVIFGVTILGVINNGMNIMGLEYAYQDVVKGSIIIAAVAVDYIRRR